MGLPIWRDPTSTESKSALKDNPSAAARSPIRRRRSPALPVLHHSAITRSRELHAAALELSQRSPRRRETGFRVPPNVSQSFDASDQRHDTHYNDPLPPVPEPRNYSQSFSDLSSLIRSENHTSALIRARRLVEHRRRNSTSTRNSYYDEIPSDLPAFTPNFAPAQYIPRLFSDILPSPPRSWSPEAHTETGFGVDSADGADNTVGLAPLRRMSRRAIPDGPLPSSSLRESWSPASTIDGLGDRDRSISPETNWEAFFGGVEPDPFLPSADSSFTSAAASASFSNSFAGSRTGSSSNSASSSQTHLTVPSQQDGEDISGRACDTDEDPVSDSEVNTSHTDAPSTRNRPLHRSMPRSAAAIFGNEPPARESSRYSRNIRQRGRDANRFVREYYASADSNSPSQATQPLGNPHIRSSLRRLVRPSRRSRSPTSFMDANPVDDAADAPVVPDPHYPDQDLEHLRVFVEALTRRNDIPDEWWISTGLTPPLAEGVERSQRERR